MSRPTTSARRVRQDHRRDLHLRGPTRRMHSRRGHPDPTSLTLLMRWSGLRIRDAVTLERHRLHGESLLLYQAKTGMPVYVPLPPFVIEALQALPLGPKPNATYFFWSGNGRPKSAVADWQRSYRRLFELANIMRADGSLKRCHPHMFRDTFAVEMLLAGVPSTRSPCCSATHRSRSPRRATRRS
jgi:integrase